MYSTPSGSQNASNISPVCTSPHDTEGPVPTSQWLDCLRSFMLVTQGLGSAILALLNILVMLHSPQCLHSSDACSLLVYLEPGLSLLAVIMLIATAMPQVRLCVFTSIKLTVWPTYYIKQERLILKRSPCLFAEAVSRPALTLPVVSLENCSRCAGTGCCCCRPHLQTFTYLIWNRGSRASLGWWLYTTYTSGS